METNGRSLLYFQNEHAYHGQTVNIIIVTYHEMAASKGKMNYREDDYYIEKILTGDVHSFALLVEKHKERAFTFAVRMVKNREDAEEITQDAFVSAYRSLKDFKGEARFTTWLYKIIYNKALSRFRKKEIDRFSMDDLGVKDAPAEPGLDGLDALHRQERRKLILQALENLKEDERAVLMLFYFNEKSIKEIEEITGLSVANIKILLHRGRKKLLIELKNLVKDEIIDML